MFAKNAKNDDDINLMKKVVDALDELGLSAVTTNRDGTVSCPILIDAAMNHNYSLMKIIVDKHLANVDLSTLIDSYANQSHTVFSALFADLRLINSDCQWLEKTFNSKTYDQTYSYRCVADILDPNSIQIKETYHGTPLTQVNLNLLTVIFKQTTTFRHF
jgi:hypothetical protein